MMTIRTARASETEGLTNTHGSLAEFRYWKRFTKVMMDDFEHLWKTAVDLAQGETGSPELHALVERAYQSLTAKPLDLTRVKSSLSILLSHLASSGGRTDANCIVTNMFFAAADWGQHSSALPKELERIVADIGGALHDTISAPDVAHNFESLPEQLLERVEQWNPES